jgi:hypothetical protein
MKFKIVALSLVISSAAFLGACTQGADQTAPTDGTTPGGTTTEPAPPADSTAPGATETPAAPESSDPSATPPSPPSN